MGIDVSHSSQWERKWGPSMRSRSAHVCFTLQWRASLSHRCMYPDNSAAPITCSAFNRDGLLYAYAVSYDWSRGYASYNPQHMKNTILLHQVSCCELLWLC